jgi:hypothetical protein
MLHQVLHSTFNIELRRILVYAICCALQKDFFTEKQLFNMTFWSNSLKAQQMK